MRSAIRIMLGLPDPALQHVAVRCKCGRVLELPAVAADPELEWIVPFLPCASYSHYEVRGSLLSY